MVTVQHLATPSSRPLGYGMQTSVGTIWHEQHTGTPLARWLDAQAAADDAQIRVLRAQMLAADDVERLQREAKTLSQRSAALLRSLMGEA